MHERAKYNSCFNLNKMNEAMETNYENFIFYLQTNEIRFENNAEARLVRFGYNIDMGTIEIVVDFEHEKRIGFFSFLNMTVTDPTRIKSLELANYFNESLNYGSIIITQTNQIVYKIMFSTFDNPIHDDQWAEIIFRRSEERRVGKEC